MDTKKTKNLANGIISLDSSINVNFQTLGFIYFVLKSLKDELPINNELNDKLLFLKSYLYRNIISYKPYNLSGNLLKLSNKKKHDQDEDTRLLSSFASGVTIAIKYITIPSLEKKSKYSSHLKKDTDEKLDQILDFVKTIPTFRKKTELEKRMKLLGENFRRQTFKTNDDKEKTILNALATIRSEIADKYASIETLILQMYNNSKPQVNKKTRDIKISCRDTNEMLSILRNMKGRLIKLNKNEDLDILVNMHFTLKDEDNAELNYDRASKIKWTGRERHLIRFVKWLIANKIINNPQAYPFNLLIGQHFYNDIKKIDFMSKQILTQSYNMREFSNDELNELFNEYKL